MAFSGQSNYLRQFNKGIKSIAFFDSGAFVPVFAYYYLSFSSLKFWCIFFVHVRFVFILTGCFQLLYGSLIKLIKMTNDSLKTNILPVRHTNYVLQRLNDQRKKGLILINTINIINVKNAIITHYIINL